LGVSRFCGRRPLGFTGRLPGKAGFFETPFSFRPELGKPGPNPNPSKANTRMPDKTVTLPLLCFASIGKSATPDGQELWKGSESMVNIRIPEERTLPDGCYAVAIEDDSMAPELKPGWIVIFRSSGSQEPMVQGIYAVWFKEGNPVIRKLIRNEKPSSGGAGRRKTFMTPTPLHIPGARVSPIPDSSHEMLFLQTPGEEKDLTVVPAEKVVWMHPLVYLYEVESATDQEQD